MVKDTVDAWRAVDGLLSAAPLTTYEPSPRLPGRVTQATWRGGTGGTQVAFVTIIGGTHTYPTPAVQTGYDFTDGLWAFFSRFLTSAQAAPKIVSQPLNNIQFSGQPASFHVAATGSAPLGYQWRKNGEDIPGATGRNLFRQYLERIAGDLSVAEGHADGQHGRHPRGDRCRLYDSARHPRRSPHAFPLCGLELIRESPARSPPRLRWDLRFSTRSRPPAAPRRSRTAPIRCRRACRWTRLPA